MAVLSLTMSMGLVGKGEREGLVIGRGKCQSLSRQLS